MELNLLTIIISATLSVMAGCVIGYYARQSLAKKRAGTLEAKLQKKVQDVKAETAELVKKSQAEASKIIEKAQEEVDQRRREFLKAQQVLLDREKLLDVKIDSFDKKESELSQKTEKLAKEKEGLDKLRLEAETKLEKVAELSRDQAKKELLSLVETDYQKDILERIKKVEAGGKEALERRAKEIITMAIQKTAVPHTQEISTTTITLPSEDIKGRIIGKEGRNIKAFEKLTGVELILDETPDTVVISCFNPIRRQIAKIALDKLIADGRIQPAKIEEKVAEATGEISKIVKEAGEKAIYDLGI
ncbi:MAG: Rnase Y domain-containing protein, partial [Patescibacteria group bacterium]